jgi:hypothetical protein
VQHRQILAADGTRECHLRALAPPLDARARVAHGIREPRHPPEQRLPRRLDRLEEPRHPPRARDARGPLARTAAPAVEPLEHELVERRVRHVAARGESGEGREAHLGVAGGAHAAPHPVERGACVLRGVGLEERAPHPESFAEAA